MILGQPYTIKCEDANFEFKEFCLDKIPSNCYFEEDEVSRCTQSREMKSYSTGHLITTAPARVRKLPMVRQHFRQAGTVNLL